MKIRFSMDRCGNIVMTPSKVWRQRIKTYLKTHHIDSDGTAFLNEGGETEEFLSTTAPEYYYLTKRELRALERGYSVTKTKIDPWTFLHEYGWDAHTLAE